MRIKGNLMFFQIEMLFEDIENRYNIEIDDITKRKMLIDICNLINREVFLLDELETYVIRCKYGIYNNSIGSSQEDISNVLGYSINTVKAIEIKAMNKIYEYICRLNKIRIYGNASIYCLNDVDYSLLERLENRGILYLDDISQMGEDQIYQLFSDLRMYLIPVFDETVVKEQSTRDFIHFMESMKRLDLKVKRYPNKKNLIKNFNSK